MTFGSLTADSLRKQIDENFNMYAESLPRVIPEGRVQFGRVLRDGDNSADSFTVVMKPESIIPEVS
jgi:hypothetical protein